MLRLPRKPALAAVKVGTIEMLDHDLTLFQKYCEFLAEAEKAESPNAEWKVWELPEFFYAAAKRLVENDPSFHYYLKTGKVEDRSKGRRMKPAGDGPSRAEER